MLHVFDPHRVVSDDYYYPTLHQYKIELEDALTSSRDQSAYFRYDESEFPGFSWRGYAVFSQAQVMPRGSLAYHCGNKKDNNSISLSKESSTSEARALIETLITVTRVQNAPDKDRRYQITLKHSH